MPQIRTDETHAAQARALLGKDVDAYCSFRLPLLHGALPVSGVGIHDGRLRDCLARSLEAYGDMLAGDMGDVGRIHRSLAEVDKRLAGGIGGL